MANVQTRIFKQFLMLFKAVKKAAKNEPSRIKTFYDQHKQLKEAVDCLEDFMARGDFERRVFHSSKKYHSLESPDFEKEFKDYKENWEDPVMFATLGILDLPDFPDMTSGEESENVCAISKTEVVAPDPEFEDSFDPLIHDGAKALEMAFRAAEECAESTDADMSNPAKIGLDAYDYLVETIGLDVDNVFCRWRNIPTIFMPAHVSNEHGLTERGSLYDLIDDAVRAYVFGAPTAAIAICRAALEMVLKKHYGLDYQFKDKNGNTRDKGLKKLIFLADEKYEFVQGKRSERLVRKTDDILHNYSSSKKLAVGEDNAILEFLKTVKSLIEKAPK